MKHSLIRRNPDSTIVIRHIELWSIATTLISLGHCKLSFTVKPCKTGSWTLLPFSYTLAIKEHAMDTSKVFIIIPLYLAKGHHKWKLLRTVSYPAIIGTILSCLTTLVLDQAILQAHSTNFGPQQKEFGRRHSKDHSWKSLGLVHKFYGQSGAFDHAD